MLWARSYRSPGPPPQREGRVPLIRRFDRAIHFEQIFARNLPVISESLPLLSLLVPCGRCGKLAFQPRSMVWGTRGQAKGRCVVGSCGLAVDPKGGGRPVPRSGIQQAIHGHGRSPWVLHAGAPSIGVSFCTPESRHLSGHTPLARQVTARVGKVSRGFRLNWSTASSGFPS